MATKKSKSGKTATKATKSVAKKETKKVESKKSTSTDPYESLTKSELMAKYPKASLNMKMKKEEMLEAIKLAEKKSPATTKSTKSKTGEY